jgi:nanoRNase/pAp phosphatase (c-di-AMP/oligoRNAs hydrolase)
MVEYLTSLKDSNLFLYKGAKCLVVEKFPFLSDVSKEFLKNNKDIDFIMVGNKGNKGTFSFRSNGFNVKNVAEDFSGGGHIQAAGAKITGWDIDEPLLNQVQKFGFVRVNN